MNGSYQGEIERGPLQLTLGNSTRSEGVGNLETVSPTEEGILVRVLKIRFSRPAQWRVAGNNNYVKSSPEHTAMEPAEVPGDSRGQADLC